MAQALTVQAPSLRPTVSSTYQAVPVVPVRFKVTPPPSLRRSWRSSRHLLAHLSPTFARLLYCCRWRELLWDRPFLPFFLFFYVLPPPSHIQLGSLESGIRRSPHKKTLILFRKSAVFWVVWRIRDAIFSKLVCILALGSGQRLLYRLGSGLGLVLVLVLQKLINS